MLGIDDQGHSTKIFQGLFWSGILWFRYKISLAVV